MKDYFRSVVKNLRTYLFGAILAIVVLLALLLVSTTAKGQSPNAEQNAELVPVNALGSLGIRIVPDSGDQGKAGVLVSFVPLSNSRENKRKGIVGVGTGDSMVRIGEFKAEPNEMVERVQVSEKSAQYQVPVTSYVADVLSVLANPDFRVTGVDGSALGYQESLRSGNSIRFDYFLLDSYTSGDKSQNGWIHFFPFDTKKLEIPIRFQQAAIVHNVEIVKPKDFFGTPTISGIHANFKEEKDGFRLMHASMNSFPTIGKDQDITIGLKMGRSWFQVFWLTLGQILLVIFPAWILGLIAAFPENRFYSLLVECIGVFSFAWLIRTQVFGTYPNMPNVLTGQLPITIYDIFFLLSLAVTIFVSLRVYFRTVKNLRKQDEAEKQNEAEKRRDELLRRNS